MITEMQTGFIRAKEWLSVTQKELFDEFLLEGGSAVRFVSGGHDEIEAIKSGLKDQCTQSRFHYVFADADLVDERGKNPDLHQIQKLFFLVARSIDWVGLTSQQILRELENRGITMPSGTICADIDAVAEHNGKTRGELEQDYHSLTRDLWVKDYGMGLNLRLALAALGAAQVNERRVSPTTEEVLLGWLTGKLPPGGSAQLKKINIYETISRQNAKTMLQSLSHWLPSTNERGLCLVFDFRPYERVKLTKKEIDGQMRLALEDSYAEHRGLSPERVAQLVNVADEPDSNYYTKAAYMQTIELLRHLIDDIERFRSTLIVVLTNREYYDDKPEGASKLRRYSDYGALQTRIGLEVRDARRQNPSASLVHLQGVG